ncbi:TIGR00730 family Rossman fold protein [Ruixingdingia sedimenti]|uniref:Cytokinin riboside 5'-monophosphate phosphoribohydrolase n=1 Tax=Ruixingdingia sedimenti TaxID=3073604 RepID=A0ABU1F9R5_9RHOB|nr:TIGR00730 family Rossman fold protein [Xinfangfangia sp. LG-4]MDR5653616.1 TIGR00730 family Rossman fold protein [Xinfangfangia sp. LG-4]
MTEETRSHPFRDSAQDARAARQIPDTPQTRAPAYRLAFTDTEFLTREELRPVRLQLELLKAQMMLDEYNVRSTIVMFGSARIPAPEDRGTDRPTEALARYYDEARRFAYMMTARCIGPDCLDGVIVTGGGPGIMEAGNRGAAEAGGISIGLNIVLPHEQAPNEYVTPDLCFNFHYFAIRKMHLLMRAHAVVIFPGGFGTLDEMFEALTLIQTGRMKPVPFLLFGGSFWNSVVNWQALADAGTISPEDLRLFRIVETAEEAAAAIDDWHAVRPDIDAPAK